MAAFRATGHTDFVDTLLPKAIANFKTVGIYEDVNIDNTTSSHGVLNYTASATNTVAAIRLLIP